jgi:nitroreductase
MDETWLGFGKGDTSELVRLMASLRSCRNFSDKPVAREILEDLVNIGTLAPSGSNQQEWSFTILPERRQVEALAGYTAEFIRWMNRLSSITPLRKIMSFVGYKEVQQYYDRYTREYGRSLAEWDSSGRDFVYYNAPCAILVGVSRVLGTPVEDAMLAAHNIRLAAHTMGLGTCLNGISVRAMKTQRSIARKMGLPSDQDIHIAIAIGWPSRDERYVRTIERKRIVPRYLKA